MQAIILTWFAAINSVSFSPNSVSLTVEFNAKPDLRQGVVAFPVQLINQSTAICGRGCPCSCHKAFRIQGLASKFLGNLFVGYSGVPGFRQPCNFHFCRTWKSTLQVQANYVFPHWLVRRTLSLSILSSPAFGLASHITLRNIVSATDPFLLAAEYGDKELLCTMIRECPARVNDVDVNDFSALMVSVSSLQFYSLSFHLIAVFRVRMKIH